jgi:ketosteroid isomerase-like protein
MATQTDTAFDFAGFKRAIEQRDAEALTALYAEDAEMTLVDRVNQPRAPRVLRGRDDIAEYHRDVCGRDMTHRVVHEVVGDGTAAYSEECRYPDGTNVLCVGILELRDGRIAKAVGVQAWDE